MNNDLISREALKKSIEEYRSLNCVCTSTIIGVRNVLYLIDNAPTISVDWGVDCGDKTVYARPKGEWLVVGRVMKNGKPLAVRCSICGNSPKYAVTSDFCPNCGADMRGDQND